MRCGTHCVPLMVPLRLEAVHEDHFRKILLDRSSDGPVVLSGSLQHMWHLSGSHWLTVVCEVHWGHVFARGPRGPCISATSVGHNLTVRRVPCTGCVGRLARHGLLNYIVCLGYTGRLCMHWSHTSAMVHAGLLAAREDHSREGVAD